MNLLDLLVSMATESWLVLGQMAPYLLFGFIVAGVLSVCISPAWIERHLGGRGWTPVFTASLFGVPLPLCSCGVIPVSASMRRHGASRAATTAFLLSTPQTGVDSIAVTYALLGPVFAVFRPVAALLTGVFGGLLVRGFGEKDEDARAGEAKSSPCTEACCASEAEHGLLARVVHYGLVVLPRDIGPALLIGVLIAGAITALVPQGQLHGYVGGGILSILLLMAAGVPVYVCATASVPIAVGFMHVGASPGAALAFLISGPATNAATLTTIWKVMGRRTMILYGVTVAVSAVVCGLLMDWLIPTLKEALPKLDSHVHAMTEGGWFGNLAAIVLLGVLAYSCLCKSKEHVGDAGGALAGPVGRTGERLTLQVSGMTCSHCVQSVRHALAECSGVEEADVHLESGRAVVAGEGLDRERIVAAVTGLGYTVEKVESARADAATEAAAQSPTP